MSDLFPVTVEDMLAECEREIALRRRVYPRWIETGRISQQKADRQIEVLKALVMHLRLEMAE